MKTIDFVYRYDPANPNAAPLPTDGPQARASLVEGNRRFALWMANIRAHDGHSDAGQAFVTPCNERQVWLTHGPGGVIKQAPFAAVVGCSDARVPTELLFGQGFNDLFIVRVAGNVLGDVCRGSVDFAVSALGESIKALVVLGHSGCGAVSGAVDAYLKPTAAWSGSTTPALWSILEKLLVAVAAAAHGLEVVWGAQARQHPEYRDALIEAAVHLNAAQVAFALRQVIASGAWRGQVYFGVYNLTTHQVGMPNDPRAPAAAANVHLEEAPTDPDVFHALAVQMAELLKPSSDSSFDHFRRDREAKAEAARAAPE